MSTPSAEILNDEETKGNTITCQGPNCRSPSLPVCHTADSQNQEEWTLSEEQQIGLKPGRWAFTPGFNYKNFTKLEAAKNLPGGLYWAPAWTRRTSMDITDSLGLHLAASLSILSRSVLLWKVELAFFFFKIIDWGDKRGVRPIANHTSRPISQSVSNSYLWSLSYVPSSVQGAGDRMVNQTNMFLSL